MIVEFERLPPIADPRGWPLTGRHSLAALPVAGRPVTAHQIDTATAAGFGVVLTRQPSACWHVYENAWLTPADWRRIADVQRPAHMATTDGDLLAWWGTTDASPDPGAAEALTADPHALLLRYAWDLLTINERLVNALTENDIQGAVADGVTIDGTLIVGKRSRILPGVMVEGCVMVGTDCKIGPNCYLRGATSIGNHCHIGQAVEIKNSLVMDHTHVGHLSYVGDSILADHVNLGAGTITANLRHDGRTHRSLINGHLMETGRRKFGAILGPGVHTGIHTSLYPGRKLGSGASTRPGQIVDRDLD